MMNPSSGMPVVTQQPVAPSHVTIVTLPIDQHLQRQNQRDWSSGICDCGHDCASCCYSFWCFSCFMCTLSTKLGEFVCGPFCCGPLFAIPMRTKTRTMYGIQGSICTDICCVCWCYPCAMCQIWRELDNTGTAGGGL